MKLRSILPTVMALALAIPACGGGATVDQSATETSASSNQPEDTPAPDNDSIAPPPESVEGGFAVDGQEIPVENVIRCEPYDGPGSSAHPDDLDIVVLGGDAVLSITVSNGEGYTATQDRFDQQSQKGRVNIPGEAGQEQFVARASHDADGNWYWNFVPTLGDQVGETPLDGPPFSISGDQISGNMHLVMDYPEDGGKEVDVVFDISIPSSLQEC